MRVQLAAAHLVGRLADRPRTLFVQHAQFRIGHGRRLLQNAESVNDFRRHFLLADFEIFKTALRLRTPVLSCGYSDLAHRVMFNPVTLFFHRVYLLYVYTCLYVITFLAV